MRTLTWEQVRARRLARGCLLERAGAIVDAVRATGGIQAQVTSAAEPAIGARVDGITRADVEAEIVERRRLVKLHAHRGTLHLVPADDYGLWIGALAGPVDDVTAAIGAAVAGACLTREELADAVGARFGGDVRERLLSGWGYLIGPAEAAGLVCYARRAERRSRSSVPPTGSARGPPSTAPTRSPS